MVEQISVPGSPPGPFPCTACGSPMGPGPVSPVLACRRCGTEQHMRLERRVVDRDWEPAGPVRLEDLVVPFAVDRSEARMALRGWTRGRVFAPRRFRRLDRAESLTSVYLPHWMWRARTSSHYTGERGRFSWTVDERGNRFRRASWDPVRARVTASFEEVVVPATRRLPERVLRDLAVGARGRAEPSRPPLLAGHRVADSDVSPEAGLAEAKLRIDELVERRVRRDIGGDAQRVRAIEVEYGDLGYRLLLLPVWSAVYAVGGREREVLVDGRTGAVAGARPLSVWKVGFAIALPLIVMTVALFILAMPV